MSTITNQLNTSNALINDYDLSKFLLGDNAFIKVEYTASGDTDLSQGLVMGRVSVTGKAAKLASGAGDGSEYPLGCIVQDVTVKDGETATLTLVNKGRIAKDIVSFDSDDLTTAVDSRQLQDWLSDIGLELVEKTELTNYDNS